MALENKKSLLQPSSTQAQQYRLQFSNLAPNGVAPATRTGGNRAPANTPAPTSLFVQAPAPVSLAAPPVIPPVIPTPVVAEAPGASEVAINWSGQAMYFDGSTYLTASAATVGDIYTPAQGVFTVVGWAKPATEGPWSPKQSIFHISSGSYESGSLEVYLTGSHIVAEFKQGGGTYTTPKNTKTEFTSANRTAGNQYGAFKLQIILYTSNPTSVSFYAKGTGAYVGTSIPNTWTISGSTDLTIGESFSGSLDNLLFLNNSWRMPEDRAYFGANGDPTNLLSASGSRLLHYSASGIQDITGSAATRIMEFETVTGTLTSTDSYFV